jgi:hypothetical protein
VSGGPDRELSHPDVLGAQVDDSMFNVYVKLKQPELESLKHKPLSLPHNNPIIESYLRPILNHLLQVLQTLSGVEGDPNDFVFILCRAYEDVVQNHWEG